MNNFLRGLNKDKKDGELAVQDTNMVPETTTATATTPIHNIQPLLTSDEIHNGRPRNIKLLLNEIDGNKRNLQKSVFLWEAGWLKEGRGRENLQQSYSPCSWACKREGTTLTRLCHNLSFSRGDHPSLNDCQLTGHSNNFKVSQILLLHRG